MGMGRRREVGGGLERALGFDGEDLKANKEGRLSERQERMVAEMRRLRGCGTRAAVWALVGSAVLVGVAPVLFGGVMGQQGGGDAGKALPYTLGVAGVFLVMALIFVVVGKVRSGDLASGKVSVVEGEARLSTRFIGPRVRMMAYFVAVGGVRFHVQKEEFEAFEEGRWYRVYYVKDPPVGVILSVEG